MAGNPENVKVVFYNKGTVSFRTWRAQWCGHVNLTHKPLVGDADRLISVQFLTAQNVALDAAQLLQPHDTPVYGHGNNLPAHTHAIDMITLLRLSVSEELYGEIELITAEFANALLPTAKECYLCFAALITIELAESDDLAESLRIQIHSAVPFPGELPSKFTARLFGYMMRLRQADGTAIDERNLRIIVRRHLPAKLHSLGTILRLTNHNSLKDLLKELKLQEAEIKSKNPRWNLLEDKPASAMVHQGTSAGNNQYHKNFGATGAPYNPSWDNRGGKQMGVQKSYPAYTIPPNQYNQAPNNSQTNQPRIQKQNAKGEYINLSGEPYRYQGQCTKCKLFGHEAAMCRKKGGKGGKGGKGYKGGKGKGGKGGKSGGARAFMTSFDPPFSQSSGRGDLYDPTDNGAQYYDFSDAESQYNDGYYEAMYTMQGGATEEDEWEEDPNFQDEQDPFGEATDEYYPGFYSENEPMAYGFVAIADYNTVNIHGYISDSIDDISSQYSNNTISIDYSNCGDANNVTGEVSDKIFSKSLSTVKFDNFNFEDIASVSQAAHSSGQIGNIPDNIHNFYNIFHGFYMFMGFFIFIFYLTLKVLFPGIMILMVSVAWVPP